MPIQTAIDSISNSQGSPFGFKNRIINGGMVIDQRNVGASVTGNDGTFIVDRWKSRAAQSSKFTVQQNAGSVTPPLGFTKYLGATSSSAYSVGSGEYFWLSQLIEGYNTADLGWGASGSQTVTLSFWVRSSLTGSFGGCLREGNAATAAYLFSYTISSANTWEYKTITIPGATIGTWQTTTSASIELVFSLGSGSSVSGTVGWTSSNLFAPTGSTSVVGTNGATWYVTGVQVEKGTQATSFDWRPYGTELQLCQRYYEKSYTQSVVPGTVAYEGISLGIRGNGSFAAHSRFNTTKRTTPTVTLYSTATGTSGKVRNFQSGADENGTAVGISDASFQGQGVTSSLQDVYGYQFVASAEL